MRSTRVTGPAEYRVEVDESNIIQSKEQMTSLNRFQPFEFALSKIRVFTCYRKDVRTQNTKDSSLQELAFSKQVLPRVRRDEKKLKPEFVLKRSDNFWSNFHLSYVSDD